MASGHSIEETSALLGIWEDDSVQADFMGVLEMRLSTRGWLLHLES